MIPVKETSPGKFEPIGGNPILTSLDGKVRAPLRTILAQSWTAEDRAKFGIYMAEPVQVPEGKIAVGQASYLKVGDVVVQSLTLEDAPAPTPSRMDLLEEKVAALEARLTALESKQ